MKQIRVLNVVGRMDRGGIETLIMNIYRNIDRNTIQFDFLAHYNKIEADYNHEIIEMGGKIFEMPQIKTTKSAKYYMIFKYKKALKNFFIEHQEYQIIHIHMTNTASILIPIAKKYGNIKVIIAHSHSTQSRGGFIGLITTILQHRIEKYATDYFTCSIDATRWLYSDKLINSGQIHILNNGVDTKKFQYSYEKRCQIREELKLTDKLVIGHVGRFTTVKNHEFILKIFECLLRIRENSILILIGDGILKEDIIKQAKKLNIYDKILFLGNRDDVGLLMQGMDIFLMPSLYEGLPVVGVEAQASGLPCVFSDTITKEVDIVGSSKFVSLDSTLEVWVREILQFESFIRRDTRDIIIKNGYDIGQIAKNLQDFYIGRLSSYE